MGTLADAIASTAPDEARLKVDDFLDRITDDADREEVFRMLRSSHDEWEHTRMANILTALVGDQISPNAVRSWRAKKANR